MGESGSGKTTLLNILASLDKQQADGKQECTQENDLGKIRKRRWRLQAAESLSFVFPGL